MRLSGVGIIQNVERLVGAILTILVWIGICGCSQGFKASGALSSSSSSASSTPPATTTPTPTFTPTPRPTPTPTASQPPQGPSGYTFCANENGTCSFSGTAVVAFGAGSAFNYQTFTGSVLCADAVFGDPDVGVVKACFYQITTATPSPTPTPTPTRSSGSGGTVARPSYNTGTGLFVLDGKLYDSNGVEFRIRGLDRHSGVASEPGINKANANTVRNNDSGGLPSVATMIGYLQSQSSYEQVSILSAGYTPSGVGLDVNSTDADLASVVQWWVNNYQALAPYQKHLIINIANEWGPTNAQDWQTQYIAAVKALRNAGGNGIGYTCPLQIDSDYYAQDFNALLNYSAGVFNTDPQRNIIFSLHSYGNSADVIANNELGQLANLAASAAPIGGMVFGMFEFASVSTSTVGPTYSPDPTNITATQLIKAAEAVGLGWTAWAWDEAGDAFQMTTNIGQYDGTNDSTELTPYGQEVVPLLKSLAVRATDFP